MSFRFQIYFPSPIQIFSIAICLYLPVVSVSNLRVYVVRLRPKIYTINNYTITDNHHVFDNASNNCSSSSMSKAYGGGGGEPKSMEESDDWQRERTGKKANKTSVRAHSLSFRRVSIF